MAAVTLGLVVVAFGLSRAPGAAPELDKSIRVTPGNGVQPVSLRDRLVVGLQARLKSEVAFCNAVAVQVQLGNLPQRMVDETFLWARQRAAPARNGLKYRPIVYFQPAMKIRANRIHVSL
jgi:hypothetical protein